MKMASEKCYNEEIQDCGLSDSHHNGRKAQESMVQDFFITQHHKRHFSTGSSFPSTE